ncbi:MAG: NDP-sugar synthase [Candidatus Eremiobacteraeota bacterium]|nr:NDP-sugar synthase [Candidatus Eremiobacteraeota bacterium]MBC5827437.1 NDP-sugar synthase [Candidatus Eremiobacteraeota bacterium]
MQALILVGGEGTRLRPLTYAVPKPMVPLLGRPFIGWIMERLHAAGVDEIILSCCYLPAAIEAHFGDGRKFGLKLHYVVEREPLGTAGAIKNAAKLINGTIYVCNGDILTGLNLKDLLEFHKARRSIASIHTRAVDDPSQFGVVETDPSGRVLRFVEKPAPGQTQARDINAGTYILEPEAIASIPAGRTVSIERETFPLLIEKTASVYARSTRDYWIDVGRPDTYVRAHRDIFDGKFEAPVGKQISNGVWCRDGSAPPIGVHLEAPVYIGAGVSIAPGARVGPYTALYDGCALNDSATVSTSVLWPNCRVGARAVIRDAILGLDVSVADDATVAPGSVLGRGEKVESSAVA